MHLVDVERLKFRMAVTVEDDRQRFYVTAQDLKDAPEVKADHPRCTAKALFRGFGYECGECGDVFMSFRMYKYCPYCGAELKY